MEKNGEGVTLEKIRENAANWPTPWVRRADVGKFTKGFLTPELMFAYDVEGLGPKNSGKVGRDIFYPLDDFMTWLERRAFIPSKQEEVST